MGSKTPITTASQSFILCVVDFHISGFHHFSIVAQWHVASGLSSPLRFATFPFGRVRFRALYPLAIIRLPSTFRASVASGEDQPAPGGTGWCKLTSDRDRGPGGAAGLASRLAWGN